MSRALVIGYGADLRSDDGAGPRAADLLAADPRLAGADVLARHQLTPELALDMSRASIVVLVDASATGSPGEVTIRPIEPAGEGDTGGGPGPSSHHVGPAELLALARELYRAAPPAFVVSVGAADLGPGEVLSAEVTAALPAVVDAVAGLVGDGGRHLAADPAAPAARGRGAVRRRGHAAHGREGATPG
ncbi:MAG: hydrogenase maturation protease [Chloroflexi bacterium]|nr:hydrogenase maturation protease [Chloroflexota bacterium]